MAIERLNPEGVPVIPGLSQVIATHDGTATTLPHPRAFLGLATGDVLREVVPGRDILERVVADLAAGTSVLGVGYT